DVDLYQFKPKKWGSRRVPELARDKREHTPNTYIAATISHPALAHTRRKMESASSVGDSDRHAELVALLAAAVQKRRAGKVARTVAVWRVVLRRVPDDDTDVDDAPPVKRTRRILPRRDYKASFWWNMLASPGLGDPGSREAKVFRRRFRIPHKFFTEVVALVKAKKWFPLRADAVGRQCIPVELKIGTGIAAHTWAGQFLRRHHPNVSHQRACGTEHLPQVQQALRSRALPRTRSSVHPRRGPRPGDGALRSRGVYWSHRID
ncbi:unnamed protein product, partial [Pylaiella littoralis]